MDTHSQQEPAPRRRGKPNPFVRYESLEARINAVVERKRLEDQARPARERRKLGTPSAIAADAGLSASTILDILDHVGQPSETSVRKLAAWAAEDPLPWLIDAAHRSPAEAEGNGDAERFLYDPEVIEIAQMAGALNHAGRRMLVQTALAWAQAQQEQERADEE